MKRIGVFTIYVVLALGVSLGASASAWANGYFETKLFNEAGEKLESGDKITPDGETAFIGNALYRRSGAKWVQEHELGEWEGGNVALSADGSTLASAIGSDPENEVGYVLDRSGGVWEAKAQKLVPSGVKPEYDSRFGASIAISENGDTILFGAPYDRGSGFEQIGGVWVFVRVGETWVQQTILEGEEGEALCGIDVALSADGDTALVKCDNVIRHTSGKANLGKNRGRRSQPDNAWLSLPTAKPCSSPAGKAPKARSISAAAKPGTSSASSSRWKLSGEGEKSSSPPMKNTCWWTRAKPAFSCTSSPAGAGRRRKTCFPWASAAPGRPGRGSGLPPLRMPTPSSWATVQPGPGNSPPVNRSGDRKSGAASAPRQVPCDLLRLRVHRGKRQKRRLRMGTRCAQGGLHTRRRGGEARARRPDPRSRAPGCPGRAPSAAAKPSAGSM